jgi:hypothetical protein
MGDPLPTVRPGRSVAFATYRGARDLTDDDRLTAAALRARGVAVHAAVWDSPDVDWDRFDLVVIRSTWDYHLAPGRYADWVRTFLARPGRLWNPPAVVLATLDKRYLIDLAARGLGVVPTVLVGGDDPAPLRSVIEDKGWDEVVIKPAISASARGTWRSSRAMAGVDEPRFAAQARGQDVLVQPYCPEIASHGEWSLVFLGGKYSHAVLKRPAGGDFRVQRHFGGTPVAAVPGAGLVAQAARILEAADAPLLYARVDGIERDGDLVLMELEMNEPYLFLSFSEDAPALFADAVVRALVGRGGPPGASGGGEHPD